MKERVGCAALVGRCAWSGVSRPCLLAGHSVLFSGDLLLPEIAAFILKIDLAQIVALASTLRMKVTVCSLQ